MLDYMRESIDTVLKYRDQVDESFANTITYTITKDILNKYIFLIPNGKNYNDAVLLKNIDSSKIIMENENDVFGFNLFNLLQRVENVDEAVDYIKKNTIIVENNENYLREFFSISSMTNKLAGNSGKRNLTRRISAVNYREGQQINNYINDYWVNSTLDSEDRIIDIDISINGVRVSMIKCIFIDFPERTFHEMGFIDESEFIDDSKRKIKRFLDYTDSKFLKSIPYRLEGANFRIPKSISKNFFKTSETDMLAGDERYCLLESSDNDCIAEWCFSLNFEHKDFVERLVSEYL